MKTLINNTAFKLPRPYSTTPVFPITTFYPIEILLLNYARNKIYELHDEILVETHKMLSFYSQPKKGVYTGWLVNKFFKSIPYNYFEFYALLLKEKQRQNDPRDLVYKSKYDACKSIMDIQGKPESQDLKRFSDNLAFWTNAKLFLIEEEYNAFDIFPVLSDYYEHRKNKSFVIGFSSYFYNVYTKEYVHFDWVRHDALPRFQKPQHKQSYLFLNSYLRYIEKEKGFYCVWNDLVQWISGTSILLGEKRPQNFKRNVINSLSAAWHKGIMDTHKNKFIKKEFLPPKLILTEWEDEKLSLSLEYSATDIEDYRDLGIYLMEKEFLTMIQAENEIYEDYKTVMDTHLFEYRKAKGNRPWSVDILD